MSGLFHSGSSNSGQPAYTGLQIQTSALGLPIPIVYGTQKVSGNIIWYGDFHQVTAGGKGKSSGKGGGGKGAPQVPNDYVSVQIGLAEGVIGSTGTLWKNKGETTLAAEGFSFFAGSPGQSAWTYLTSNHPTQALAYPGTAHMDVSNYNIGTGDSMPALWLECSGNLAGTCPASNLDADPAQVILDFLTNPSFGAGFPASKVDLVSLQSAANSYQKYVGALGIGFSAFINSLKPAASYLDDWLSATNTAAVWTGGLLKFIPYGDGASSGFGVTYTPNLTVTANLSDDDFVAQGNGDHIKISRTDPLDAYNDWKMEIKDRAYDYNANTIESKDQASIEQLQQILASGVRLAPTVQAHFLANASMATMCLELMKNRQLYVRNLYEFFVSWDNGLIEVMDLVTLSSANLGLSQKLVRVQEMEEQDNGTIKITAEEYLPGVGWSVAYPEQATAGYVPNSMIATGPVNPPVIFEPPAALCGASGPQVWIVLSGPVATWGGAAVWMSTDDVHYTDIGTVAGQGAQGTLSAALVAYSGANPDSGDTLAVDLTESAGVLGPVPAGGAAQGASLCWVDGELIAYQNETLTAISQYRLTTLYRAMYGTGASAHALGASFASLTAGPVFKWTLPTQASLVDATIYFKFQSFNLYGAALQDISTCTAYSYTVTGNGSQVPILIQASESGVMTSGEQLLRYISSYNFFIPAGLAGTTASEGTAATASATFTLAKNGSAFGTIAIAPNGVVTLAAASETPFAAGDVLTLAAPSSPDATLANVAFNIAAVKTA